MNKIKLSIIIPVYNEDEIIEHVINSWVHELNQLKIDFNIIAINDGSRDNTLKKLMYLREQHSELEIIDQKNSGHGPSILNGYKHTDSDWIFQVDSDNEMSAKDFYKLWNNKKHYDFIIAVRDNRVSPLTRRIISFVSRLTVSIFYGKGVHDVNAPFRLFRAELYKDILHTIPKKTFAPNLIISGYSAYKNFKILQIPIPCKNRQTGEVSIKKGKLLKAACLSLIQTISFRYRLFSSNVK